MENGEIRRSGEKRDRKQRKLRNTGKQNKGERKEDKNVREDRNQDHQRKWGYLDQTDQSAKTICLMLYIAL